MQQASYSQNFIMMESAWRAEKKKVPKHFPNLRKQGKLSVSHLFRDIDNFSVTCQNVDSFQNWASHSEHVSILAAETQNRHTQAIHQLEILRYH